MSDLPVTRIVVVTDPVGVHVRTAASIASVVRRSQSAVTLIKGEERVSGGETLQILTLLVECGETVVLEAMGPDAKQVLDALEPIFAGNFDAQTREIA